MNLSSLSASNIKTKACWMQNETDRFFGLQNTLQDEVSILHRTNPFPENVPRATHMMSIMRAKDDKNQVRLLIVLIAL